MGWPVRLNCIVVAESVLLRFTFRLNYITTLTVKGLRASSMRAVCVHQNYNENALIMAKNEYRMGVQPIGSPTVELLSQ